MDCAAVAAGAVYFACAFGLAAFGGYVMVTIVKVCGLAAGGYTGPSVGKREVVGGTGFNEVRKQIVYWQEILR